MLILPMGALSALFDVTAGMGYLWHWMTAIILMAGQRLRWFRRDADQQAIKQADLLVSRMQRPGRHAVTHPWDTVSSAVRVRLKADRRKVQ